MTRRLIVPGPVVTPVTPTLMDAVQWVDSTDAHWKNGITYRAVCGNVDSTYDNCVVTGSGLANPTKEATTEVSWRGATPFTIFGEIDCSPVGFWDDAEALTATQFGQVEFRELERIFWSGIVQGQPNIAMPHLAADAVVLDSVDPMIVLQTAAEAATGGPFTPAVGLSALEQYLGECYIGVGNIFVGVTTFNALVEDLLIFRVQGGRFQTALGNWVIPMRGSPNTQPSGAAATAGTEWMYATGTVFGYRGRIQQVGSRTQSFDRGVNTEKMIVERTYVLGWDCCHAAAEVSIEQTVPTP